jgi:hypothetical protein
MALYYRISVWVSEGCAVLAAIDPTNLTFAKGSKFCLFAL